MNSVVVLQARTNSSRLPAKVMLPISGIPLVVLAARRAGNTGRSVIVATSLELSDDGLVRLLQSYGLKYFRGSLENTLDRIVNALAEYDDQTVVFRLTADNTFPDGALLDELEDEFLLKGIEYLCCNGEASGLPYGMSVEVTRLTYLREAAASSTLTYDQEHVTPYIKRKYGIVYFEKYKNLKKGHYRCTIDCLDDYISMQKVFENVNDPIKESSFELVRLLECAPFQPIAGASTPKLILGTAQLGTNYGIANTNGQPSKLECEQIIKTAIANGVSYVDTASAYGNSETIIGMSLRAGWEGRARIITKLSPLQDCPEDMSGTAISAFVDASIYKSCAALRMQQLDVLMLHRAAHLTAWNGAVWQRLLEHKASGIVRELGVSVQNPYELSNVVNNSEIRYIQMPFNLLDWRWDTVIPKILSIKDKRKLTIHARSTLLQGLLASVDDRHWSRANVDESASIREWLASQTKICQRDSIADLCFSYINALEWIDGLVVGMETMSQLAANVNFMNLQPLSQYQMEVVQNSRPRLSESTLNPAFWKNAL